MRGGRERRVRDELDAGGFESWYPTRIEVSKWSDREKRIERPLFPGYVFARFDASTALIRVLQTADVISVLGYSSYSPEPISDAEISSLRRVVDAAPTAPPCPYVAGARVRVENGPLAGVEGVVTRTRGATRIVVAIEILKRAVSVEIDAADLQETNA